MNIINLFVLSLLMGNPDSYWDAQTEADSIAEKKIEAQGMVLLTNNAFALIPAFSFDAPAVMAFLSIGGKRFKYEPEFSFGLNGRPWMWDNWLRHSFINKPKFTLSAGVNPNLFFISTNTEDGKDLIEAHRSITREIMATFQDVRGHKYILSYRYNQAFDFGTVSGHSIDFSAELESIIPVGSIHLDQFSRKDQIQS